MEISELQALIAAGDFNKVQEKIIAEKPANDKTADYKKQYDPKQHDVTDPTIRKDKQVKNDNGTSTVPVTRIPIPMQQRIVRLAAAFLCAEPIQMISSAQSDPEKNFINVLQKTWDDNKLDYKAQRLAKLVMSETEAAELWYSEEADPLFWKGTPNDKPSVKARLRMRILAPSLGDTFYPVYSATGDMIAFGRAYTVKRDGKDLNRFDLYTATINYFFQKGQSAWEQAQNPEKNPFGKIPVVYYSQDVPEWYYVQEMIDRLEKLMSNLGDTNDYHMSPKILVEGEIDSFVQKGEPGGLIKLKKGGKASYLGWDKSPESLKMEVENLRSLILDMTSTPDISFDKIKGLGQFSGVALKMLFSDAHLKASDHEESFGECIQRRINFLKTAMAEVNKDFQEVQALSIKPKFTYYMPQNDEEIITLLSTATQGDRPILSQKTAVKLNPFVEDADKELEQIGTETNSAGALDKQFN